MSKSGAGTQDLDNEAKITLGLLNVVHDDSSVSQRSIASDLGIALGLANAYLKRCVKKGLIKVSQAPANRYAYYLTPQGFSEKGRLTAEYLSQSFNLFRVTRTQSAEIFDECKSRGWNRVALYGLGDLTEIVVLSAQDHPIDLVSVINGVSGVTEFSGLPVVTEVPSESDVDAIIICDINNAQAAYDKACAHFPAERVLFYRFLGVKETPQGYKDKGDKDKGDDK
ncbi:MAG: winged helix-turn-helix transcriptional regulator [Rhodospirillales bacterium]|nr:winged helix-turn-helix transcriptional regulator [Rhodospirillales bacterium]